MKKKLLAVLLRIYLELVISLNSQSFGVKWTPQVAVSIIKFTQALDLVLA